MYVQPGATYPPDGDPLAKLPPFRDPMEEFHERLSLLTPHVYVTWVLLAINIIVYIAMVARGVHPIDPKGPELLAWGADFGPVTMAGEWWRMMSCAFVHIGAIHIVMNMACLVIAGPMIERMFGNIGFLTLYLVSALGGSLASLTWNPLLVSAGASGAVFGMYGGLLAVMLRQHGAIPPDALAQVRNSGLAFVGYNLVFGFTTPNVDNAAHLGGLATGFLMGLLLAQPLTEEAIEGRWLRNLAALVAGALLIGGGVAGLIGRGDGGYAEAQLALTDFAKLEPAILAIVQDAAQKVDRKEISETEFAETLNDKVLVPWGAAADRFAALKDRKLPKFTAEMIDLFASYTHLRREQWKLVAAAVRDKDSEKMAKAGEKGREADALGKRILALSNSK